MKTLAPEQKGFIASPLGQRTYGEEVKARLPEFVDGLAFPAIAGAWTALDFLGHDLFEVTRGENTPPYYYRNKIVFGTATLAVGKIAADVLGGSTLLKAFTLTTVANALLQFRYLFTLSPEFNLAVFLIHELVLFPLSFLLVGQAPFFLRCQRWKHLDRRSDRPSLSSRSSSRLSTPAITT